MRNEFDCAQELEQRERDAAVARVRAAMHEACGSGACDDCGDSIPVERLQALPNARLCVDCQTARERKR
jgi:DnaK suppressor protein